MSRSFQDDNFLVWEVFPSGGKFGFDDDVKLVFHSITDRRLRPRFVPTDHDSADAEQRLLSASDAELRKMLEHSRELR